MHSVSAFILTFNSEKYLAQIIQQLKKSCDEILVLDSGSNDFTKLIAEKNGCRFMHRDFDNFRNQRAFALSECQNNLVLMVDSDEVPDELMIESLAKLKNQDSIADAYRLKRVWIVLGKKIHAVYPVVSPDYPVRLFDKRKSNFDHSPVVHEEPSGYKSIETLGGSLHHYTFESKKEINEKLERYTTLSAETLLKKKKNLSVIQQWLSAIAAFMKWYFAKGGWRDGSTGVVLAKFAFDYTFLKYGKARVVSGKQQEAGGQ